MDEPRKLTSQEIDYILSAIEPKDLFNDLISQNVFEAHRFNIQKQLEAGQIKPSKIEALRDRITKQYYRALLKAGDHFALSAAHAVVQPIYQASLNAFHSAGSLIKTSDIIRLANVIVNANKTIAFALSTLNVNRLFTDSDLYTILRRQILEIKFKDIQINSEIYNTDEASEILQDHSRYYSLINWYSKEITTSDYLLHIKLDKNLLYIKYLTPFDIARKLFNYLRGDKPEPSVLIFPSPATIEQPFIDIILPQKQAYDVRTQIGRYSANVGDEGILALQLGSTFFNSILIPQIAEMVISGVKGAHEVSVQKSSFGGAIVKYQALENNIYRCQFRRYHLSNKMMALEDLIKLYSSYWQKHPDPMLESQGYDTYDIQLPASENNPIEYFNKNPYVYGIVKTYRRTKKDLVGLELIDLLDYDYIDPYLSFSTNFYYIRDTLGINACNNILIHSLQNIIAEQSSATYPEHAVLIASYISVLGDLFPYTFTGYSQHNIGPLASASFQDPLGSIITHSLGSRQPITGVDASIISGTRPEIGQNYPSYREPKVGHKVNFAQVATELMGKPVKEPQSHPSITPSHTGTPSQAGTPSQTHSESVISGSQHVGRVKPRGRRPPITERTPLKPTALNSAAGSSLYIPVQTTLTNETQIVFSNYELMMNSEPVVQIPKGHLEKLINFFQ